MNGGVRMEPVGPMHATHACSVCACVCMYVCQHQQCQGLYKHASTLCAGVSVKLNRPLGLLQMEG